MSQARLAAMSRAPGGIRLPYPEEVIYAIVMTVAWLLTSRGEPLDVALMLILAHHAYLRPGELRRVKWKYLTGGLGRQSARMALTLHPTELAKASKTGEFDETVILDLDWLVVALRKMQRCRDPEAFVVPGKARDMSRIFDEALLLLDLPRILGRETLHVLRHSGPSADAWMGRRTIEQIQVRGRWRAASSVRRYQKGGRVAERLARCGDQLIAYAMKSHKLPGAVLTGRCAPFNFR